MKLGMTSSIEPGYYEDGAFGIRIENVALVVEAATPHNFKVSPAPSRPLPRRSIGTSLAVATSEKIHVH
jgi:Xaa-Pro aminopeptidase